MNKLDFCFLSEPWMNHLSLPPSFFYSLNLNFLAFNPRQGLTYNLWCLCPKDLNSIVVCNSNQFVACILEIGNKNFGNASVYNSTIYIEWKELCLDLSKLIVDHPFPWSYIGDFNCISGAHEHMGSLSLNRSIHNFNFGHTLIVSLIFIPKVLF